MKDATQINPAKYASSFVGLCAPGKLDLIRTEKYASAIKMVTEGLTLHVACNGVWSASGERGNTRTSVQSYEKIGYHTGAEYILEGYLNAGGTVIFHNFDGIDGPVKL